MPEPRRKLARPGIVLTVLSVLLVFAVVTTQATRKFRASERTLADYCRGARVGTSLEQAKREAGRRGLVATADAAISGSAPTISVESDGSFFSAMSFCSLTHDGERITGTSYNPWYH